MSGLYDQVWEDLQDALEHDYRMRHGHARAGRMNLWFALLDPPEDEVAHSDFWAACPTRSAETESEWQAPVDTSPLRAAARSYEEPVISWPSPAVSDVRLKEAVAGVERSTRYVRAWVALGAIVLAAWALGSLGAWL